MGLTQDSKSKTWIQILWACNKLWDQKPMISDLTTGLPFLQVKRSSHCDVIRPQELWTPEYHLDKQQTSQLTKGLLMLGVQVKAL